MREEWLTPHPRLRRDLSGGEVRGPGGRLGRIPTLSPLRERAAAQRPGEGENGRSLTAWSDLPGHCFRTP